MKRVIFFLLATLLAAPALADTAVAGNIVLRSQVGRLCFGTALVPTGPIITGVALNASAALRTVVFPLGGRWSKLDVTTNLTRVAATTLDIAMTTVVSGSAEALVQSGAVLAGTRTLTDLNDTKVVGASVVFKTEYDVRSADTLTLVWSGTSGGASDTIIVHACAVN